MKRFFIGMIAAISLTACSDSDSFKGFSLTSNNIEVKKPDTLKDCNHLYLNFRRALDSRISGTQNYIFYYSCSSFNGLWNETKSNGNALAFYNSYLPWDFNFSIDYDFEKKEMVINPTGEGFYDLADTPEKIEVAAKDITLKFLTAAIDGIDEKIKEDKEELDKIKKVDAYFKDKK